MTYSTLFLRVAISLTYEDEHDHFCQLTTGQIDQDVLKKEWLLPQLSQHIIHLERFSLTNEEVSTSLAKRSDAITADYLATRAVCQYRISTLILASRKDTFHLTVNIHLIPN